MNTRSMISRRLWLVPVAALALLVEFFSRPSPRQGPASTPSRAARDLDRPLRAVGDRTSPPSRRVVVGRGDGLRPRGLQAEAGQALLLLLLS